MSSLCLRKRDILVWVIGFALLGSQAAMAQQQIAEATAGSSEPAAAEPVIVPKAAEDPNQPAPIDKRILGVLPNYRTADGTLPYQPISAQRKITIGLKDSFDWPNYLVGGAFAGLYQLENQHPQFGQGLAGYGRYYGTSYADQVIGNMLTEAFLPVVFHQDPRYFRKGRGSILGRTGYALSRVVIAKTDHGNATFNFAEVLGNGMAASISNSYYNDGRSVSDTLQRAGTQIATDALSQVLKEFWPDIKRRFHRKNVEQPGY